MMPPLVVLQAGAFPFPLHQGSQVYVRGMSAALVRAGHRVLVACWDGGVGTDPPGVEVRRTRRVRGAVTASGPHWSRLPQDADLVRVIRRILSEVAVDVIHAHNVEAPVLAWLARLGRRVPIVYDQHTRMAEELPTYWPVRGMGLLGRVADRVPQALCDAAIALSEDGAATLRQRVRQTAVVPPAVEAADLRGADPDRARARWDLGDRPWVAYAGNTDPYQDLPVWFEAMARLPDAGLLLITGDDTGPWERRADALGIVPDRRRFVRTREFAETRDALSAAAIAVSPRTKCAGFPIKLLNYAGLGLPTVAARGSAHEGLGVVAVPDHDPAAMADAIAALLADPDRRSKGDAARAEVLRAWTWESRVPALEALYRSLGDAA